MGSISNAISTLARSLFWTGKNIARSGIDRFGSSMIIVGLTLLTTTRDTIVQELNLKGQATSASEAGITDALSWFRRQSTHPVAIFEPVHDPDKRIIDTEDAAIGIVREFEISNQTGHYGRYEVMKLDPVTAATKVRTYVQGSGETHADMLDNYDDGIVSLPVLTPSRGSPTQRTRRRPPGADQAGPGSGQRQREAGFAGERGADQRPGLLGDRRFGTFQAGEQPLENRVRSVGEAALGHGGFQLNPSVEGLHHPTENAA